MHAHTSVALLLPGGQFSLSYPAGLASCTSRSDFMGVFRFACKEEEHVGTVRIRRGLAS